jgi:AbrB family looped-hinge helix DNA binding protein
VIPKELRERAGIHPGSEVDFELDGDRVVVVNRRRTTRLGGSLADGPDMAAHLLEDRAREPK